MFEVGERKYQEEGMTVIVEEILGLVVIVVAAAVLKLLAKWFH